MKVNLFVSAVDDPYADIHTDCLTESIIEAVQILENGSRRDMIPVVDGDDIRFVLLDDIFMFKAKDKKVEVFTENTSYIIRKSLVNVESSLNSSFIRISKSAIVNIKRIQRVSPSFKGTMFIHLDNDIRDSISRKYLPDFKKALDL